MGIILVNALDQDSVRMLLGRRIDLGIPYGATRESWPVLLFEIEAEAAFVMRDMYPRLADLKQAAEGRTRGVMGLEYARLPWSQRGRACLVTIGQLQQAIPQPVNYERPTMFMPPAYDAATRGASCRGITSVSFLLAPYSAFWVEVGVEGRSANGEPVTVPVRSMSTFCPRAVSQRLGGAYQPQGLGGGASLTAPAAPSIPSYQPIPSAMPTSYQPSPMPSLVPPSATPWQTPWHTPPPGSPVY